MILSRTGWILISQKTGTKQFVHYFSIWFETPWLLNLKSWILFSLKINMYVTTICSMSGLNISLSSRPGELRTSSPYFSFMNIFWFPKKLILVNMPARLCTVNVQSRTKNNFSSYLFFFFCTYVVLTKMNTCKKYLSEVMRVIPFSDSYSFCLVCVY